MRRDDTVPSEIGDLFRSAVVLKHDAFSIVERGFFRDASGEQEAVLRRIDRVPWWSAVIARHLFRREARALDAVRSLDIAPRLLFRSRHSLVRSWIDGLPLHIAKPQGNVAFFRSARRALRALHRAGVTHNDLAKQQNWLCTADGRCLLTDFQLAARFRRRHALFRLAAYEDLRHLLKHKRRYAEESLTARERRVLARKAWPTRIWMATGKRAYYAVTRGLLDFTDREGGGRRLVRDAPLLAARLKTHPAVRDAAIVAFPDRRTGTGLYAVAEADALTEAELMSYLAAPPARVKPPERLQIVRALPRHAGGEIRTDILALVAMNQIDLLDRLIKSDGERMLVDEIVAGRRNLRDRFAF